MSNKIRVIVTGSRYWDAPSVVSWAIINATKGYSPENVTIVHGDCSTGADKIADELGYYLGYKVERHAADWGLHGKSAGPKRNKKMVDLGADIVLAFPRGLSKGTRGCMKFAKEAGLEVKSYEYEDHA